MIRAGNPLAREPRYELIARLLRHNIALGHLPAGFVLLAGPIAEVMATSRVPVQAALRQLLAEGLIHRFEGRGYVVGPPGADLQPLRRDIRAVPLAIPPDVDQALQTRGTWRHVYDAVEAEVAACQIFGEFRIIETELADHLGVSRTVARDVLARLQERGLIRKDAASHWVAGPLTARTVREKYELRGIMEPAALRLSGPFIRYPELKILQDRLAAGEAISAPVLGHALFDCCIAQAPNATLVEMIAANRLLLSAVDGALDALGLPQDDDQRDQYRTLLYLITNHPIDSACEYLRDLLSLAARRSVARMKIAAVVSDSERIPPYLTVN